MLCYITAAFWIDLKESQSTGHKCHGSVYIANILLYCTYPRATIQILPVEKLFDAFQTEAVCNYVFQCVHSNNKKHKRFSKQKVDLELFLKMECIVLMYAHAETYIVSCLPVYSYTN